MSESYAEVIVHDEKDVKGKQLRICLIVITLLCLLFGAMYQMLFFLIGIVMIPVSFSTLKNRYREYEYLLVSDELDISVVKNRCKRKKLATYALSELQCMAPVRSHRLDHFHSNPQLKVRDYSSGNEEHTIYSMIFASQGMLQEVRVEPSEAMLNEVRMHHASVVFSE
ncbi:hypothetical protein C823_004247 [Eubacterium plexicaudatum ASF492]|uniref:Uncharacterized protein n=1 Tax=Eubacterium plexicaudatum ASF492 TaxID=1235802 RepID=N2A2F1_9FIRM|nr:hypothetical protein C823_004247 [Eubacterium plexicaudatum ASF492]